MKVSVMGLWYIMYIYTHTKHAVRKWEQSAECRVPPEGFT